MTTITFDTLKFVKTLKAGGFDEKQAETLAEAQVEIFDKNLEQLSTRRDLQELQVSTRRDLQELQVSTKRDLQELEYRMTIKLGTLIVAAAGLLFAALRFFPPIR